MSFRRKPESRHADISGNFTGGVTPVPIPNTEVKPTEVDGTIVTRLWESRTLPVYFKPLIVNSVRGFLFYFKAPDCNSVRAFLCLIEIII